MLCQTHRNSANKKLTSHLLMGVLLTAAALNPVSSRAQVSLPPTVAGSQAYTVDLPTVLRLARAQNLDVQLARERLNEARAEHSSALSRFFPWLAPGAELRRHEGRTQAIDGTLLDVDKQNVTMGATLTARVDFGEAIFASLAAKQMATASAEQLHTQEEESTVLAAQGYFDLLKAKTLADVSRAALRTSEDYGRQIHSAVTAGVAFKGDELRIQTQTERYRVELSQASERQRLAAARLAHVLHMDPTVELLPQDDELVPITLVEASALQPLVQQAMESRPELKRSEALVAAARSSKNAAVYGPIIPALGVQAFIGEFGGGIGRGTGNRGDSEDYYVGLSWRIGPGGLFDFGRINASKARLGAAELGLMKIQDDIAREVVEGYARAGSLLEQIAASRQTLAVATETFRLTRERKQLGVGVVLEDIQAQQELNRARTEHLTLIAEFNKTQYGLSKSLGQL